LSFIRKNESLTLVKLLLPLCSFVVSDVVGDKTQIMVSEALVSLLMARRDICCSPPVLPHNFQFVLPHNFN